MHLENLALYGIYIVTIHVYTGPKFIDILCMCRLTHNTHTVCMSDVHLLNCSRVVSASLLDPVAVPPNTVTTVSPGPRLEAVRE